MTHRAVEQTTDDLISFVRTTALAVDLSMLGRTSENLLTNEF